MDRTQKQRIQLHELHHNQFKQKQEQQQMYNMVSPAQQQQQHSRFVRSNSNVHQLTPTNKKSNPIPLYSRESTHQTNVTTPNPTSISTTNRNSNNGNNLSMVNNMTISPQAYDETFKYAHGHGHIQNSNNNKNKHQYMTSRGNLIAIERSIGAKSSPKHGINQKNPLYDILTNDPIPSPSNNNNNNNNKNKNNIQSNLPLQPTRVQRSKSHDHVLRTQRAIPRKPLLPPKIIKLDSPTCTTINDLSLVLKQ